jgi:cytochrome c oxidase subunit II
MAASWRAVLRAGFKNLTEIRRVPLQILKRAFSVLMVGSVAMIVAGAANAAPQGEPKVIEVSAKKYEFTPAEIHVAKGTKVELKVHSVDETHGAKLELYPEGAKDKSTPGLLFDHPDDNGKVEKNVDQVLVFTAAIPGTYEFKCAKVCGFGHGRMKGKLIVE